MTDSFPGIDATSVQAGRGVTIGAGSRIVAREVVLGDGTSVGDGVTICCDRLQVGAGSRIGAHARIVSPEIAIGASCTIGDGLDAELNEYLRLGRLADLGRGVRMTGQGITTGEHLWLTDAVMVGGGGARGPRSYLAIGDRSAVMDRCYINLSEPVTIGDDTALSNGVTILTHSLWQPALAGGTTVFAPVTIGSRNILYVNAVVGPGVSTGNDVTVGAGALVLQDVPDGTTALGNPARIIRSTPPVPRELDQSRRDTLLREVLRSYADALPVKGAAVERGVDPDSLIVTLAGAREAIRYIGDGGSARGAADITLGFGAAPPGSRCHFDLAALTMVGTPSAVAEDLRDHLRRRTIRIFTDRPFRALPPAQVARLRDRLRQT